MADLFTDSPAAFEADPDLPDLADGERLYARHYDRIRAHFTNLNNRIRGVGTFALQGALSALDSAFRDVTCRRQSASLGVPLTSAMITLGAGWGVGASVSVATGSTAQRGRITVTAAGVPAPNPTTSINLASMEGVFLAGSAATIRANGGSGSTFTVFWSQPSVTPWVWTHSGTPVAASTYSYDYMIQG